MSKIKYKKVVHWKRKPKKDYLFGGLFFFLFFGAFLIYLLHIDDFYYVTPQGLVILTFISTSGIFFGARMHLKGCGKGKEKSYIRVYKR